MAPVRSANHHGDCFCSPSNVTWDVWDRVEAHEAERHAPCLIGHTSRGQRGFLMVLFSAKLRKDIKHASLEDAMASTTKCVDG